MLVFQSASSTRWSKSSFRSLSEKVKKKSKLFASYWFSHSPTFHVASAYHQLESKRSLFHFSLVRASSPLPDIISCTLPFKVTRCTFLGSLKNHKVLKMPVDIQKVLVCDAVDQSCVDLLKLQGIAVDYKLKLPKNELIAEAKVRNDKVKVELCITTTCEIFWFRIFVLSQTEVWSISSCYCIDVSSRRDTIIFTNSLLPPLPCHYQNYDAIIVRSDTKITADVLESGSTGRLKVVGRAGVGIDNIDTEAATKHKIIVLK